MIPPNTMYLTFPTLIQYHISSKKYTLDFLELKPKLSQSNLHAYVLYPYYRLWKSLGCGWTVEAYVCTLHDEKEGKKGDSNKSSYLVYKTPESDVFSFINRTMSAGFRSLTTQTFAPILRNMGRHFVVSIFNT